MAKKIAIIGSGISGLGCAYALHHAGHDIRIFEANDYLGGHSRTIEITQGDQKIPVDTGFIVFNDRNYPHLVRLFKHLGVATEKSDMSFGVDITKDNQRGWLEYSSNAMLLWRNLKRPEYRGMLFDILRFNRTAPKILDKNPSLSLGGLLAQMKMGEWFRHYYLQAMGAAIWSTPSAKIEEFPARSFIKFFQNHGLLTIFNQPQWYTVTGGSREYVQKITANFKDKIRVNCPAEKVSMNGRYILVESKNGTEEFDEVVFACHADQALALLASPTDAQKEILGAFDYQPNTVVVHSDENFMPKSKKCWASWVYLSDGKAGEENISLTYWMNNLQNLDTVKPVLITLNPENYIDQSVTYDQHSFTHPVFDEKAVRAQDKIEDIQGQNHCWFAGAYQRYGFHEDGLLSAVNLLNKMDVKIPW